MFFLIIILWRRHRVARSVTLGVMQLPIRVKTMIQIIHAVNDRTRVKKSRLSKNILLSDISLLLHESSLTFYRLRQSKLLNCRNRANSTLVLGLESDSKRREKILKVLAQFCTNTFLLSFFTTFISTKKKYFREFNKNNTVISAHRYNFKFQNSVFLNILQQYPNT